MEVEIWSDTKNLDLVGCKDTLEWRHIEAKSPLLHGTVQDLQPWEKRLYYGTKMGHFEQAWTKGVP